MGKLRTFSRRAFLVGSTAITGGVAFGVYAYKKPGENPLLEDLAKGEAALTPYVKITSEGITLITPRADSGQGVYSVQAMLIAEELDVDLEQISVDPGMPSATYYNTALAGEAVPFAPTDESALAETMRSVMDAPMKFLGVQVTGGSSTVPDQYTKLRVAGAVARETLKQAASQQSGIPVEQLKTASGMVILPDASTISYQQLAAIAAKIEPAAEVPLKPEIEWRYIGKQVQRIDILAKSTGTLTYGIDRKMEGMVFATIRSNPRQGGTLISLDAVDAEKIAGVDKVIPLKSGFGVIAKNTWLAFKGADAVKAEWGPSVFPAKMDDHWETLASSFIPERQDSQNKNEGDVDAALNSATAPESRFEAEYRVPYLVHAPLEPLSLIIKITDERVDLWTGTQIPGFTQNSIAKLTGHALKDVHVHAEMMGGSFGHRLEDDYVLKTVELGVAMKGTPVKMTYSREEDMTHDFPRQIAMARGRGTIKDGKVEAYDLSIAMPSVIASQMGARQGLAIPGPDVAIVAGAWEQPYSIPNYRITGYRAPELAPISSWRSVGASSNGFFHESFLDEMIHLAGADPLEERRRLMFHENSRKTLEAVGEMSNWGSDLGPNRGRGVAFTLSFGVAVAEVVEVTSTDKGIKIDKVFVAAEVGKVIDPINFDNLVKGGVIWGLGHAINCQTTYEDGIAQQANFHAYEGMRMYQCPQILVRGLENGSKVRGIGEPPVPPAAPALANAIFAATGMRLREMPFNKFIDFV